MTTSAYGQRISSALNQTAKAQPYLDSYRMLEETAQELQSWLTEDNSDAASKIHVSVEPGFLSQIGQQLNIVLQIPSRSVRDTLFRAYVPPTGTPVSLDFYGEQAVPSGTPQEIQENVVQFLAQPEIVSRMNMYRELLRRASDE